MTWSRKSCNERDLFFKCFQVKKTLTNELTNGPFVKVFLKLCKSLTNDHSLGNWSFQIT